MNVLVDTTVWSLAFRHKPPQSHSGETLVMCVAELKELIKEMRAQMIGPIRQEILSGISDQTQFQKLGEYLQSFEDLAISSTDYERAAEFFNICRSKGVQGTHTDFLICAVAEKYALPIFTTDKDFKLYTSHLPISLYQPRQKQDSTIQAEIQEARAAYQAGDYVTIDEYIARQPKND